MGKAPAAHHRLAYAAGALAGVALFVSLLGGRTAPRLPPPPGGPDAAMPRLKRVELRYQLRLLDTPAATFSIVLDEMERGGRARGDVRFEGRTLPAVRRLWRYEASGRTITDAETGRPLWCRFRTLSNGRERVYTTRFLRSDGRAEVELYKPYKNSRQVKAVPIQGHVDALSAFLCLRTAALPCTLPVLYKDGLYELAVRSLGPDTVEVPAGRFRAELWSATVTELPEDEEDQPKVHMIPIWVDSAQHIPLRSEVAPNVTAELVWMGEPSGEGVPEPAGDEPDLP